MRIIYIFIICLLFSCSGVVPIWSGKKTLEDNTLYFSKPIEFQLEVQGEKPDVPVLLYLELDVTYYTQIGRTDLPLSLIFEKIGARQVEFKIKIGNDEPSTNPAFFTIYLDAKAEYTIAYGPGLCDGTAHSQPNFFLVRARNKNNENRISGRDKIEVNII